MKMNKKIDRDPHKFPTPIWARIQNIVAVYGTGALIILPWDVQNADDWILMFITAIFAMFLVDFVFERIVMKPIKLAWVKEHIREYHPEDIDKLDNIR